MPKGAWPDAGSESQRSCELLDLLPAGCPLVSRLSKLPL